VLGLAIAAVLGIEKARRLSLATEADERNSFPGQRLDVARPNPGAGHQQVTRFGIPDPPALIQTEEPAKEQSTEYHRGHRERAG
jgi:hypothetical protein